MNRRKISIFNRIKGRSWYRIDNKADFAEVMIYDEIGLWGIQASDFVRDFSAIDAKSIKVRINTPGGSVFDGMAIFNAIREHKATVETHVDALAASIGSIIALAGDTVHMAKNAYMMIHNPWGLAMGDSAEMRKYADLLDKISGTLLDTYAERTGREDAEIRAWMDEETWFTAKEAKDAGLIDTITGESDAKAAFDLSVFARVPEKLKTEPEPKVPETEREFEAFLRDAGFSRSVAVAIASGGFKQRDSVVNEITEIINNNIKIFKEKNDV